MTLHMDLSVCECVSQLLVASLAGCENECQEESESRGAFGPMTHHDPSSGISMKFDQAFHNN